MNFTVCLSWVILGAQQGTPHSLKLEKRRFNTCRFKAILHDSIINTEFIRRRLDCSDLL